MALPLIYFWKKAPFVRILPPFVAGILLQWHCPVRSGIWVGVLAFNCILLSGSFFLPLFKRYRLSFLVGIAFNMVFISTGALLVYHKDIRNNKNWLGNIYRAKDGLLVTLDEPLIEKTRSFKANAVVRYLVQEGISIPVQGRIIIYFEKDSAGTDLGYGSEIFLKKSLQETKNSGNPGGFDYKRYCLFRDITHQVFLKTGEFESLDDKKQNGFRHFIYALREKILAILRKNIPGTKELGLAEALLIGYKNDLEQTLVQSYTNTGVVHIIAISGLHLGLIYWLLVQLCRPLQKRKRFRWLSPILIITGLWLFSLLAGAQPSVLRSALMFTCIVAGDGLTKKTSVFNTLAFSAFLLLCINPYWLWDVGFQLSYSAVLGIVIFMKPVYNRFYIKNKALDFIWKLNSVTLAAQVFTIPVSIYHFHQFPNYFLLTNLVAVPLSSLILLSEVFLCLTAWLSPLAFLTGKILTSLIWFMNTWIGKVESIRFSLWDGLQITLLQAGLLVLFAACTGYWLMEKSKKSLVTGLLGLAGFAGIRCFSFLGAEDQQKIIVYNVPQKKAIDFIEGRKCFFIGDTDLAADGFSRNFHLKPARTLLRVSPADSLSNFEQQKNYICYAGKNILLMDMAMEFLPTLRKPRVDLLVLSKNPRVYISNLASALNIRQIVFDGSVPAWKTVYWKKDCDSLHIPWYDVATQGAFVMRLR